jgi:hypothetical protein
MPTTTESHAEIHYAHYWWLILLMALLFLLLSSRPAHG